MSDDEIFHKVLTVGPSSKVKGGMTAVLDSFREYVPGFRHLPSNSSRGTLMGIFVTLWTILRLPVERMRGRTILHVHSASGKSFVRKSIIMRVGRLCGYRIIFHCHGGASKEYFRRIGIPKAKRVLSMASTIVVLSKSWQRYFQSTFGFRNVRILNNPVAIPSQVVMPSEDSPLRLLYLGLISDAKGVFDLLDVIDRNQRRWRGRVELCIGGNGEIDRLMEQINAQGTGDMIQYAGWLADEDKEAAFANSHVLILPSYNEGLPVSILEAMARGKAVIATTVGGVPEVITTHENGFLFTPGDKRAIEHCIDCYLLNPDLVRRHGQRSRERIHDFDVQNVIRQLLHIYRSLAIRK